MIPSDVGLDTLVKRTIALYNRTHSPNATAKLTALTPPMLIVQLSGSFCTGCGTFEITEAFADQLKTLSNGKVELKHDKTTQTNPHSIQAIYTIKTK
jgi:TRAP-type mannitol/chloroaromatic compound transport system substrate-binding protein